MPELRIDCPFVDHTNPKTMAVNEEKEVGYCHACHKSWALEQIEEAMNGDHRISGTSVVDVDDTLPIPGPSVLDPHLFAGSVSGYLGDKGLTEMDWEPSPDRESYIRIYSHERETYQDRNMEPDNGLPRFVSDSKDLFWSTTRPKKGGHVWLCEGVGDALALRDAGVGSVAAVLGSDLSDSQAYDLRGTFVLILFDADSAGFLGSRKAALKLREFEVPHQLIELPKDMVDPGEAFTSQREVFLDWLQKKSRPFVGSEETYVEELFTGQRQSLRCIPSTIGWLNSALGGGLKGCNVIAGTPGAGKSSLVIKLCTEAARDGYKVLINSLELSKAQMWARVASTDPRAPVWSELEQDPTLLTKAAQKRMLSLAENLHIRVGMSLYRTLQLAEGYDMVVVDYVQRLPEIEKSSEESRSSTVGNAMKMLANLSRDENKVVIAVSSMARAAYKEGGMGIFKESGDIEYVVSGAFRINGEGDDKILTILKNTRGEKGMSTLLSSDLGHCRFFEPAN